MATDGWIEKVLPLQRPEYAKQPEALLTDLLWRSPGSSISQPIKISRGKKLSKLVPRRLDKNKPSEIIETFPIAEQVNIRDIVSSDVGSSSPLMALLNSIQAPRSRGDKSTTVVPIHPDLIIFQTLHGLVNKPSPADLSQIIETIGWLGGASGEYQVAYRYLEAVKNNYSIDEGFTGFLNGMITILAERTWSQFPRDEDNYPDDWPSPKPNQSNDEIPDSLIGKNHEFTPFHWFWEKWCILCDPKNGWNKVLPARRFVDWATCILRTGLSFSYLWESNLYILIQDVIRDELNERKSGLNASLAKNELEAMLTYGARLVSIEPLATPASQKDIWPIFSSLLARGYEIRESFRKEAGGFDEQDQEGLVDVITRWVQSLPLSDLENLAKSPKIQSESADNAKEFVRYLLRPRLSDDDTADQSDFYHLTRSNKARNVWLQPGPEWFVVITSLLSGKPGGNCTLGLLLDDLRKLGIRVDRSVLIELLEEVGLSTDSPDADNALVISSGF